MKSIEEYVSECIFSDPSSGGGSQLQKSKVFDGMQVVYREMSGRLGCKFHILGPRGWGWVTKYKN